MRPDGRRCVLVTGFGPFLGVTDNPSARLALALDDPHGDPRIIGRVIPVSYASGPRTSVEWALDEGADLVLGIGVAMQRTAPFVERVGRRVLDPAILDADGQARSVVAPQGEAERASTLDVERLASLLGCGVSDDAGAYVCNAWLYEVVGHLGDRCPVGFLHLPPQGMDPALLREAIHGLLVGDARVG